MKRKWGTVLLSTLVVSSLTLSACGSDTPSKETKDKAPSGSTDKVSTAGFPIVKEPIKLKMFTRTAPANGPFKDMPVFQDYEKLSNVQVEWIEAPTDGFAEKKNLLFASNELPDVMYRSGLTPLEAIRYGTGGQLIPLEGLIDKYAPNLKKLMETYPEIRPAITTPEGHIYAIPGIVTVNSARTDKRWMNQAWLKKLNLKEPETTDELYEVLKAFRDKDPNGNGKQDEIPMTARASGGPGLGIPVADIMGGSFGLDKQLGYYINIENDKVNIWMGSDRNKEMLMFLNKLYSEKLLDQEVFSQKEAQYIAKQGTGNTGFFFDQTNNPMLGTKVNDQYIGISPVKGPHGDRLQLSAPVPRDFGAFAITSVNKNPEATMRWIDYFYSDEGSTLLRFGRQGDNYELRNGIPYYTDAFLATGNQSKITPYAGGGAPHLISEKVASFINPPQVQEAQKKLDPYMPKIFAAPLFDEQTSQQINILRNDIDKYYEEQTTKFIAGALSFDKWGEFQSTLKKMKIDELQKLYQDAYDKMKQKK